MSSDETERYSRQIVMPQIGAAGQERLSRSRVLIVGAGGLGSAAAFYLAAAGVGTIGIADPDVVEVSNLQRQILHKVADLERPKTASATDALRALNPQVTVIEHAERLAPANAQAIVSGYQVVVDGSDNFATRYLLSDACVLEGKALAHAAVMGFGGQAMTVAPRQGPCYRCLHPRPPAPGAVPEPAQAGILGAVAGLFGTVEAIEAIKCLLGAGDLLVGRVLIVEGLEMEVRIVHARRDPRCAVCGEAPTIASLSDWDYEGFRPVVNPGN